MSNVTVRINGNAVNFPDQQPVIVDDRVLVPLRGVFEALGFNVNWDPNHPLLIQIRNGRFVLDFSIGRKRFSIHHLQSVRQYPIDHLEMDVAPQLINGRAMIPLRAPIVAIGHRIEWNAVSNTALITTGNLDVLVTRDLMNSFGWLGNISDTEIIHLNEILIRYNITDIRSIRLFLATCAHESGRGRLRLEGLPLFSWVSYSIHDRGAGYLQITHRNTHLAFLASVGDGFNGQNTAEHIANNWPWESAAWFWTRMGANMRPSVRTAPDTLNNFAITHGDALNVFLLTQYAINGWGIVDGVAAPTDAAALAILNDSGVNIVNNQNRVHVGGHGSFRLPIGWIDRYNQYNAALNTFI